MWMDIIGGLIGGLILTWIAAMLVKNAVVATIIGFVIMMIIFGFGWLGDGINVTNVIASLVGAIIGWFATKGNSSGSTPPAAPPAM